MTNKTLVLGVGNIIRRDDGIGPRVIRELKKQKQINVDLVDGGIDGLALIDLISQYDRTIIIDAVDMSLAPGTIKQFSPSDTKINIRHDALSTHGFGLAEIINLMNELNITTKLTIIGIQPKEISFGEDMSAEVDNSLQDVITMIKNTIK